MRLEYGKNAYYDPSISYCDRGPSQQNKANKEIKGID